MLQYIPWILVLYAAAAFGAWSLRHRPQTSSLVGAFLGIAASGLGLYAAVLSLLNHQIESRRIAWNLPYASFSIGLDPTTSLFLIPAYVVAILIALNTLRRLPGDYAANQPHEYYPAFNICLAGVTLILTARNATLFLFAWEVMTLASFLLIENTQRQHRSGGWVYLTAGHLGCACLFAMFALMAGEGGNLDFTALRTMPERLSLVFVLALLGFGGKIGLAPMHAYYPESYPQAPSHVGALLSGIVGNMGVYGLMRILLLLGRNEPAPAWWGYVLLAMGLSSGVIGAARSFASKDLFRLLAWSSLENYGLMAAGLGLGLIGGATGSPVVSALGFGAAGMHMLNHAVSKSLLFFCAGSIHARTGTRSLDAMGGLAKRLPLTAALFLIGALGAAAVPPLNGFAGEFLLLLSAFGGITTAYEAASFAAAAMFMAIILLAVTGGLAVAAYAKAFGFIFLGNGKGAAAASDAKERRAFLLPHGVLAALALASAVFTPFVFRLVQPGTATLARRWQRAADVASDLWTALAGAEAYQSIFVGGWLLIGCVAVAALVRRLLLKGKTIAGGPTWDCGYAAPDPRMQYTASSFARPLAETFQSVVNLRDRENAPTGIFPAAASFESSTPDITTAWGFGHLFRAVARAAARVRVMQGGQVQMYLLYMAAVLVLLLAWKLWNP